jgi:hypothetical protein
MTNHGSAEHGIRRAKVILDEALCRSDDAHEALGKARLVLRQCEDLLKGT